MKIKFKEYTRKEIEDPFFDPCVKCAKKIKTSREHCYRDNNCKHGYYVRTRPRKTRDRRLLEALLADVDVLQTQDGIYIKFVKCPVMAQKDRRRLLAIKEAMQKGNK